jgi:hypothetical protein
MLRRISRFGNESPRAALAAEVDQVCADNVGQRLQSETTP